MENALARAARSALNSGSSGTLSSGTELQFLRLCISKSAAALSINARTGRGIFAVLGWLSSPTKMRVIEWLSYDVLAHQISF